MSVNQVTASSRGIKKDAKNIQCIVSRLDKRETILDFGCGKGAYLTRFLRKEGYNIFGYDFPGICRYKRYIVNDLNSQYSTVIAYNVLNVQETVEDLDRTLNEIKNTARYRFICNLPNQPRYGFLNSMTIATANHFIADRLKELFFQVKTISEKVYPSVVFECWKELNSE